MVGGVTPRLISTVAKWSAVRHFSCALLSGLWFVRPSFTSYKVFCNIAITCACASTDAQPSRHRYISGTDIDVFPCGQLEGCQMGRYRARFFHAVKKPMAILRNDQPDERFNLTDFAGNHVKPR